MDQIKYYLILKNEAENIIINQKINVVFDWKSEGIIEIYWYNSIIANTLIINKI
jgi:hypothetical protein